MKSLAWSAVFLPFALASAVPRADAGAKVDYTGFKGLRVKIPHGHSHFDVEKDLAGLLTHVVNFGHGDYLDIVVSPEKVASVEQRVDAEVVVHDVGAALAEEGEPIRTYAGSCYLFLPLFTFSPFLPFGCDTLTLGNQ